MNSIYGNLDDLYLFCQVVQAGSLQKASEILHLPVSTMSRRLTALEDRLGVRLLERTGRQLAATETGKAFFNRLHNEFNESEMELRGLLSSEQQVKGNIRLIIPYTMYETSVSDLVAEFLHEHPEVTIDIRLSLDDSVPETDRDLVLGFYIGQRSDLIARPYFKSGDAVCASEAYVQQHGLPISIPDLDRFNWVSVAPKREVRFIASNGKVITYHIKPRVIVNDVKMLIKAVDDGLGIGCIPRQHIPLARGKLVHVLPEYSIEKRQAYLYYRRRKHQPKALSLLIDKLLSNIGEPLPDLP